MTVLFGTMGAALGTVFGVLADVLGWLAGRTRPARLRTLASQTAELLDKTPEGSNAYRSLRRHLDRLVHDLVTAEEAALVRQINISDSIGGLVLVAGAGYGTYALFVVDHWWRWFFFLTGIVAAAGLSNLSDALRGGKAAKSESDAADEMQ